MADLIGQSMGNYRIESQLGAGGMGEVYRAVHVRLNRPAAIKILHANQAADPTFQARFLREARAAAALSHPNIVEVFDFGEQDGASYLVMELVPDGSLRTLLQQRAAEQGWTLGLGMNLVRQAAEGLAYAHGHGMIHRDIKPDNLLLQRLALPDASERGGANERYQLKISDFGLARLVDDHGELTVTGMVMGTPTYMSPEQCQGSDLDGRSDLYSLGVVLYEVATGSPPFRVRTLSEAVFKHISAPPTPPRELRPDLPEALEVVILRCLAKNPDDRFANGIELAEALDGALGVADLKTVVSARPAGMPVTPPPIAPASSTAPTMPVDNTAPTVLDSRPDRRLSVPPVPVSADAAGAAVDSPDLRDDSTIRATVADSYSSRIARRQAVLSGEKRVTGSPAWPASGDGGGYTKGTAGSGLAATLLARPRTLVIGGALALTLLLIVGGGLLYAAASKRPTPTARATATIAPTATPADKVTFHAALSSPSAQWPYSSRSYFNDGGYEINGAWLVFSPTGTSGDTVKDGSVSVRLRQVGGVSDQFYGLVVRAQSNATYYVFGVSEDQHWTFMLVSNGNHRTLVAPTLDTHITRGPNASNTLMVKMRGSHFTFFANGVQIGQADDSTLGQGRVAIVNVVGRLAVVYNDITVAVAP